MLSKYYGDKYKQNPWMFGGLQSDFILFDLENIINKKNKNVTSLPQMNKLIDVAFIKREEGNIKRLSGFKSGHFVPKDYNYDAITFVKNISEKEINEFTEKLFQNIKKNFNYKLRDIAKQWSDGKNIINAKDFDISISYNLNKEDLKSYIFSCKLYNIKKADLLENPAFEETFNSFFETIVLNYKEPFDISKIIEHIEDNESDKISCEYNSDLTECNIQIEDHKTILIFDNKVKIRLNRNKSLKDNILEIISIEIHLLTNYGVKLIE